MRTQPPIKPQTRRVKQRPNYTPLDDTRLREGFEHDFSICTLRNSLFTSPYGCFGSSCGARVNVQFFEDCLQVPFDSIGRDNQFLCDFLVRKTLR